jgi:DNA-3-methyladenine glycosylase I
MDKRIRCGWCNVNNPLYVEYHDNEWGVANFEDKYLFEMLILESFQAGLSWECVLNRRQAFYSAFDGFDIDKICRYGDEKIEELMNNTGIIRNRRKITAAINNAAVFRDICETFGSFYAYLSTFTGGERFYETERTSSELSDRISRDLYKRGMRFVGTVIIYSYLQAIGIINSHEMGCFLYKKTI